MNKQQQSRLPHCQATPIEQVAASLPTPTASVGTPERIVGKKFDSTALIASGAALSLAVLTLSYLLGKKYLHAPRKEWHEKIDELLAEIKERADELGELMPNHPILTLAAELKDDYPELSAEIALQSENFENAWGGIKTQIAEIETYRGSHLPPSNRALAKLQSDCVELLAKSKLLLEEQRAAQHQLNVVATKREVAGAAIARAQNQSTELAEWFRDRIASLTDAEFFTSSGQILEKFESFQGESKGLEAAGKQLLAADLAESFRQKYLYKFKDAVNGVIVLHAAILASKARADQTAAQWPDSFPNANLLFQAVEYHVRDAMRDFVDDSDIGDAVESVHQGVQEINAIDAFLELFSTSMDSIAEKEGEIQSLAARNYTIPTTVSRLQRESMSKLAPLTVLLNEDEHWERVSEALNQSVAVAGEAASTFEQWVALQSQNTARLVELASEVAALSTEYDQTTAGAWELLEKYPESNRPGLAIKVQESRLILKSLFDDPHDAADLASLAADLNSMKKQQFDQAEADIAAMYQNLVEARVTFGLVYEQLKRVQYAEKALPGAVEKAKGHIEAARASFAEELDRLVAEETEEQVIAAEELLNQVPDLVAQNSFILALEQVTEVSRVAQSCQKSADDQVRTIRSEIAYLNRTVPSLSQEAHELTDQLNAAPTTITDKKLFDRAARVLEKIEPLSLRLLKLDDLVEEALKTEIESLKSDLAVLPSELADVRKDYKIDQEAYQAKLNTTMRSVKRAGEAVQAAREKTAEYRAGNSGKAELQQAVALLPRLPYDGQSVSELESVQKQAAQAERYANSAIGLAQASIDRHYREEARREAQIRHYSAPSPVSEKRNDAPSWMPSTYNPPSHSAPPPAAAPRRESPPPAPRREPPPSRTGSSSVKAKGSF